MYEENTFNFEREKIAKRCDEFEDANEQIKYLKYVLKEYKTNPPNLDVNYGLKPTLENWIDAHLKWREYIVNKPEKTVLSIVKTKGYMGLIVRIFESMVKAEILSESTKISQITRLFFTEKDEAIEFQNSYSGRKTEIYTREATTTDKRLMKFLKTIIKDAYNGRESQINELSVFLDRLEY